MSINAQELLAIVSVIMVAGSPHKPSQATALPCPAPAPTAPHSPFSLGPIESENNEAAPVSVFSLTIRGG